MEFVKNVFDGVGAFLIGTFKYMGSDAMSVGRFGARAGAVVGGVVGAAAMGIAGALGIVAAASVLPAVLVGAAIMAGVGAAAGFVGGGLAGTGVGGLSGGIRQMFHLDKLQRDADSIEMMEAKYANDLAKKAYVEAYATAGRNAAQAVNPAAPAQESPAMMNPAPAPQNVAPVTASAASPQNTTETKMDPAVTAMIKTEAQNQQRPIKKVTYEFDNPYANKEDGYHEKRLLASQAAAEQAAAQGQVKGA